MKFSELASLDDEKLVHQEMGLQDSLMRNLLHHRLGKLVNTSQLRGLRRDIARIQTLLTQREAAASLGKGTLKAKYRATYQPEVSSEPEAAAGTGFLKSLLDSGSQS